jgi:serine/threonine protein kinase
VPWSYFSTLADSILCINPACSCPQNGVGAAVCSGCGAKLVLGDRFRPVSVLGQGGFGRTFLAWDDAQTPPVRCVIKQHLRADLEPERFYAEAERLTELGQHPQIPSLIALLESSRGLCLVQSYIPGTTLAAAVEHQGPWTEAAVRSLLTSLLPVVQFIHDRQVIHRDIKPANIILPGGDRPPVLVDFGAAKALRSDTLREKTGTVIGSAGYAAPEQALGKAVFASDLYGLGLTCLHALTGQHPFDLYALAEDRWVWRPYAPHPVSLRLVQILDRMVARSLRSRYSTAAEVLADLQPGGTQFKVQNSKFKTQNSTVSGSLVLPSPLSKPQPTVVPTPDLVVQALAVSPDGRWLATANRDRTVQVWELGTRTVRCSWGKRWGLGAGHGDTVTAVAWQGDSDRLWSVGLDGVLKQWSVSGQRLLYTQPSAGWGLTALVLVNSHVITGATDGRITLWPRPELGPSVDLVRHSQGVTALAVSPDGQRFASAGDDGAVRLWVLPTGRLLHTWTGDAPQKAVVFHPQAPWLVTGAADGTVTVRSLDDLNRAYPLDHLADGVGAIAVSPYGQWLAIGGCDGTLNLWNFDAKRRVATLHHDWGITALAFTPDGHTLISSGNDETLRFWSL